MLQTVRIRKVSQRGRHFINQAGLHIHADAFLVPIPILLLVFAPNRACLFTATVTSISLLSLSFYCCHALSRSSTARLWQSNGWHPHRITTTPISSAAFSCPHMVQTAGRVIGGQCAYAHTIVRSRLGQGKSTKPFGGQIFYEISFGLPIRQVCHELQQQTAESSLDQVPVRPFALYHVGQGLRGLGCIGVKLAINMSRR